MPSFALLALITVSPVADLPKWEEVLAWMHRDARTLRGTYEEWEMDSVSRDGEKTEGKLRRWLDGKRYRQELDANGEPQLATASDGDRQWIAIRPAGFYVWDEDPVDPLTEKFDPPKEDPEGEQGTFQFGTSGGYDIMLRVTPAPTVTKLEEVGDERRLTLEAKLPDRKVVIHFRFEKEKWLLKGFEGASDDKKSSLSLKRTKAERNRTFGADVFALDAKVVEGLQELTGENREDFLNSFRKGGGGGRAAWGP